MPKAFVVVERLFRPGCPMLIVLGSMRFLTSPQSICGTEARHGRSRVGKHSIRPANHTTRSKSARNGSYMPVAFAKEKYDPLRRVVSTSPVSLHAMDNRFLK